MLGIGWYTALKVLEKRGPQKPPVEVMAPVVGEVEEGLDSGRGEMGRNGSETSFQKEKEGLLHTRSA